ncbi:MAG: hypothetical protein WBN27_02070, partial [Eudoraea sp.]
MPSSSHTSTPYPEAFPSWHSPDQLTVSFPRGSEFQTPQPVIGSLSQTPSSVDLSLSCACAPGIMAI